MADLHLFGGEKGGVGKSFVARTAVQYHLDQGLDFTLYETDRSNPDVMRIYREAGCQLAVFSEGEKYEDKANQIYNSAMQQRVIVNLPAQVFIPVKNWIENNELLDLAKEDGIRFIMWFICDGGYDSLHLFRRSLEHFQGEMQHVLVKNGGKCDDWEPLDKDDQLQNYIADYQVKVIEFPRFFGNADRNKIDELSLTFAHAREHEGFGSISRQRVKRFLKESYAAFEETGLFAVKEAVAH